MRKLDSPAKLIVGCVLCITCTAFLVVGCLSKKIPEYAGSIIIPIFTLGIFLIIYSFDWRPHIRYNLSTQQCIDLLRWNGLPSEAMRVYFNQEGTKRIVICTQVDGRYTYLVEDLHLFSPEEFEYFGYGKWEFHTGSSIPYETEASLLTDIEPLLVGMQEEVLPPSLDKTLTIAKKHKK